MSRIRGKDTQPERTVRSLLHRMGYRFSLRRTDLPGKPDIVMPKHRTVIFVHGCFWHQHPGCKHSGVPKSNRRYWRPKLQTNVHRDKHIQTEILNAGWRLLVLWECQIEGGPRRVGEALKQILAHRKWHAILCQFNNRGQLVTPRRTGLNGE
ncbi:MAG: very short patch repair endonuclease [Kiritimatiellae bacterium]|nr:very short patch repair endonuclease [Kiritimatiellia bacterium]